LRTTNKCNQQKGGDKQETFHLTDSFVGPRVAEGALKHLTQRFPRPKDLRFFYVLNLCREWK
jgi:hypothetical protein